MRAPPRPRTPDREQPLGTRRLVEDRAAQIALYVLGPGDPMGVELVEAIAALALSFPKVRRTR